MRFKNKVAFVTGAASGIGLACAAALAREGAKVALVDVDAAKGAAAAKTLGRRARFFACDVGDSAQVRDAVAGAVKAFGRIDVLINNAGIIHPAEFLDVTEADFDRVVRVNLKGEFLVGQAVARQMVKQGKGGAIVNMASVNAVLAIPNQTPYVVSKGGVNQLTKVMALSLADHGIRVNALGPGTIATELARKGVLSNPEARRRVMSRTPLKRLGAPEEVAAAALFLASDESSYITGTTIYPDGGRLALNYTVAVAE